MTPLDTEANPNIQVGPLRWGRPVASPNVAVPSVVYETKRLIEAPNWTPDGRWLVHNSEGLLYQISPDGSEGPSLIDTGRMNDLNNDHVVSPDSAWLYVCCAMVKNETVQDCRRSMSVLAVVPAAAETCI